MMNKFKEGLVFGGGFGLSFIALWYLSAYLITPMLMESQVQRVNERLSSNIGAAPSISAAQRKEAPPKSEIPFHELSIDEQIKQSSVIAIAKYELGPNGQMKATIKEFLKKDPNVTVYYNIGDEHPSSSYFPEENTSYGDGRVIFFTGNPASMRMSLSYSGDRLHSLGDMPMELLKKKCNELNT